MDESDDLAEGRLPEPAWLAAKRVAAKPRGRPFERGRSGNPNGRPRGSRNRATLAAARLLEGESEALTRKAIEAALGGDRLALRLCLQRILPPCRQLPIDLPMPPVDDAASAIEATAVLVGAVADGQVTLDEAGRFMALLAAQRKIIESAELEQRLVALEESSEARQRSGAGSQDVVERTFFACAKDRRS